MKKISLILTLLLFIVSFAACSTSSDGNSNDNLKEYTPISYEEAKKIMDEQNDIIILDVRTKEEFESGHIKGATLFPSEEINKKNAAEILPDKNQTILVYCRSGRRSKISAQKLADMGYTSVYEFGGINSWPYETEGAQTD